MKRLIEIRYTLIDMAEAESKKLYRLAWRAEEHGCSNRLVDEIRSEARWLHGTATAYPERLITWDFEYNFKFAFKTEGYK